MQMLLVENLALTFISDAQALATGLVKVLVRFATAPIERIARASDVGGVLSYRNTTGRSSRGCLFPFHRLRDLT
jgi:hypothetical protein